MTVFEELREGKSYDIRDEKYQREAHGEMDRCRHLCWKINSTDPAEKETIMQLENELLNGQMKDGNFFTPPFQIDCANRVFLGKNVFANHGLTVMSIGTITIEDSVATGSRKEGFQNAARRGDKRNLPNDWDPRWVYSLLITSRTISV